MLCDGVADHSASLTCQAARGSEHLLVCSLQAGMSLRLHVPSSSTAVVAVEAQSIEATTAS